MDLIRRNTIFDQSEAADLLIAPPRNGHFIAVYSVIAQGHEDGQVVQLRGSGDGGQTFVPRHWPIKCDEGTGGGESLGGSTPIAYLEPGEGLYLSTEDPARVAGNIVWDYLPGRPTFPGPGRP